MWSPGDELLPGESLPPEVLRSGVFFKPELRALADPLVPLLEQARTSKKAENRLFDRLLPSLRRCVRRILPGEENQEDVVQESLLALVAAFRGFRGDSSVLHFAIQVTARIARATRRSRVRAKNRDSRSAELESALLIPPETPHATAVRRSQAQILRRLMSDLPSAQTEAFVLRVIDARSVAEIAALTGVRESAVRTRLRRARSALRLKIECDDVTRELLSRA